MKKRFSYSLVLILVFILMTLSALTGMRYLLTSPAGNQWALQQLTKWVPELKFSNVRGHLNDQLFFDMTYQDASVHLSIDQARIGLDIKCLWQLTVCVSELRIDVLNIDVPVSSENDMKTGGVNPSELADVTMPMLLRVKKALLGKLQVTSGRNQYYQASNIAFSGRWINHHIRLKEVTAQDDYCDWRFPFSIRLAGSYPIKSQMSCVTQLYPLKQIEAQVNGNLQQLGINFKTAGELAAKGELNLALLTDKLPMEFSLRLLSPFFPSTDQADIKEAELKGKGNLDVLTASLTARLTSPRIPFAVTTTSDISYDFQRLNFNKLKIMLPQGTIESEGHLTISDTIQWQAQSQLQSVALSQIEDYLQGEINGTIKHTGTVFTETNADPLLEIAFAFTELNGQLFGQEWQAKGKGELTEKALTVAELNVQQSNNRMNAQGKYSFSGIGNFIINSDIEQFEYIVPSLSGSLKGKVAVSGTLLNPTLQGTLLAQRLTYQTYSIEWAKLELDWQPEFVANNNAALSFRDLQIGDSELNISGNANVSGQVTDHELVLQLFDSLENRGDLSCRGHYAAATDNNAGTWRASCPTSQIALNMLELNQQWQLSKPIDIEVEHLPKDYLNVALAPFCYRFNTSEICNTASISVTSQDNSPIEITAKNLDVNWMAPWLPKSISAGGLVQSKALIDLNAQGYSIEITGQSDSLHLDILQYPEKPIPVAFEMAQFDGRITPTDYDLQWFLNSPTAGKNKGSFNLKGNHLLGEVEFEQIDVEPFWSLAQTQEDEYMDGVVSGAMSLWGTVDDPRIKGSIKLRNGTLHSERLPLPVNNVAIDIETEDKVAEVSGNFLVDGNPGKIDGLFNWQQPEWWSKISLKSETIAIQPDENVKVYFEPNLQFSITPKAIHLNGDVFVPKARIYLKSLPEQAVSVSSDAEVIGEKVMDDSQLMVTSNLDIKLGDDVKFDGFGLETNLTGNMRVIQKRAALLRAKGIIRLEKGVYKAYGQSLVISDGDLIFIDDIENPQLRLSATRDKVADDVVVGLRVSGRARSPEITVFSIPDMPQQEKFHYLLTGRAPNTESDSDPSNVAMEAALALALESNSGLTRKAGEKLGIEDLTITTSTTENRSEVGVSGYITPDLMIKYGVGMFEAVNSLTLNYRLRQNLFFEVISGKSNAFDLLWSFDKD